MSRKIYDTLLPMIVGLSALAAGGSLWARPAVAQEGAAGPGWTEWKDPQEGAFTVQVPEGWTTSGGISRNGETNFRQSVQSFLPDNDLLVQIGDSSLPPFVVPGPDMLKAGLKEGQMIKANGGAQILLLQYMPAEAFNVWYASNRLQPIMDDFKVGITHKEDDMSQKYTSVMQKVSSLPVTVTVAETSFTGKIKANGKEVGFAIFSVVLRTEMKGGTTTWLGRPIMVGWDRNDQATASKTLDASVLTHLMTTWQDSPEWIQQYDEKAAGQPGASKDGTSAGQRASTIGTYWKSVPSRNSAAQRIALFLQHIPEGAATRPAPPPAANNPFGGLK